MDEPNKHRTSRNTGRMVDDGSKNDMADRGTTEADGANDTGALRNAQPAVPVRVEVIGSARANRVKHRTPEPKKEGAKQCRKRKNGRSDNQGRDVVTESGKRRLSKEMPPNQTERRIMATVNGTESADSGDKDIIPADQRYHSAFLGFWCWRYYVMPKTKTYRFQFRAVKNQSATSCLKLACVIGGRRVSQKQSTQKQANQ